MSFVCQFCVSQGWVLQGHVVLACCNMCLVGFMWVTPRDPSIPIFELFKWIWATCCRIHLRGHVVCICLGWKYWWLMFFSILFIKDE